MFSYLKSKTFDLFLSFDVFKINPFVTAMIDYVLF